MAAAAAAATAAVVDRLVFALNGRRYEVAAADVDPSTRLVEFIRTRTPFKGTKLGCGEGTCVFTLVQFNLIVRVCISPRACTAQSACM